MNFVHHQTIETKPAMSGKALDTWLELPVDARAALALSLTRDVTIAHLTRAQAARLTGLSRYSVALAAIATPDEREGLRNGSLRLRDVRVGHARPRALTDSEAATLIVNRYSADAIMAAFDRVTAPAPVSVAAE